MYSRVSNTYFTIYKIDKYISSNVKMKIKNIGKLDLSHIDRKFEKIVKNRAMIYPT